MIGPYVVAAVWVCGIIQSAYLLTKRPWSKSPNGAWSADAASVTDTSVGSPLLLLAMRTITFVFALAVVVSQIVRVGVISFKFYTVWSFCLLIVYFGLAAAASWRRHLGHEPADGRPRTVNRQEYAIIALLHVVLTTVWIVDTVTWTVLWPMIKRTATGEELARLTRLMLCFTSYTQHGGNAGLMLVEFGLNAIPIHGYMLGYVGLWSALFTVWAVLWHHLTGLWLYPFLNWTKPWAPIAYVGLFLGHWAFFGCVIAMQRIKERLLGARRNEHTARAKQQ